MAGRNLLNLHSTFFKFLTLTTFSIDSLNYDAPFAALYCTLKLKHELAAQLSKTCGNYLEIFEVCRLLFVVNAVNLKVSNIRLYPTK